MSLAWAKISYTRKTPKARSMKQLIDLLGFTKIPNSTRQSSRPTWDRGPEHVKNSRPLSRQRIRKTGSRAGISQRLHATHVQWDASSCPQQRAEKRLRPQRDALHTTPGAGPAVTSVHLEDCRGRAASGKHTYLGEAGSELESRLSLLPRRKWLGLRAPSWLHPSHLPKPGRASSGSPAFQGL